MFLFFKFYIKIDNTEAFLLCLMPFGVTYMLALTSGDYLSQSQNSGIGRILVAERAQKHRDIELQVPDFIEQIRIDAGF